MKISTHLSRKLPRGFARLLTVALAASALVLPTQALAQAPVVSEKTAGLWQPSQSEHTRVVSEKTAGLWQIAQPSAPLVSEKLAGLWQEPSTVGSVAATTAAGFDWDDAGIGAAVTLGSLLAAAGALTMRRRHSSLAH